MPLGGCKGLQEDVVKEDGRFAEEVGGGRASDMLGYQT